jgi:hypothetical protein
MAASRIKLASLQRTIPFFRNTRYNKPGFHQIIKMSKVKGNIPTTYTHCHYCELPFTADQYCWTSNDGRRRTRDHFIPRSKGGENSASNIYIVCQYCNTLKGNYLPFEFIYWLRCKIEWKEYPGVSGITYNYGLLYTVKKNVSVIFNSPNKPYDITIVKEKNHAKEKIAKSGIHYLNYLYKDCPCVGFIDRAIGHGIKQYQNAYYHSGEGKYVFYVNDGIIAFYKKEVEKYIKPFFPTDHIKVDKYFQRVAGDVNLSVNSNTPRIYKEKIKDDWVERWRAAPEPNFHEDQTI